jgi:hypothetical protein
MDGVRADFDAHCKQADNVDWQAVRAVKDYYFNMPPIANMRTLWDYVVRFNPIVLTGVPKGVDEARTTSAQTLRCAGQGSAAVSRKRKAYTRDPATS